MADIFLSYSRADTPRAKALVAALETRGWTVWWDPSIDPGKEFAQVIEEQLAAAKCVIVLWSTASIKSRWVRAEASEAGERGILVPVLLENVQMPLVLRQLQAASLEGWSGDPHAEEFRRLSRAVYAKLGDDTPEPEPEPTFTRRRVLAVGTVVVALATVLVLSLTPGSFVRGWLSGSGPDTLTSRDTPTSPDSTARGAPERTVDSPSGTTFAFKGRYRPENLSVAIAARSGEVYVPAGGANAAHTIEISRVPGIAHVTGGRYRYPSGTLRVAVDGDPCDSVPDLAMSRTLRQGNDSLVVEAEVTSALLDSLTRYETEVVDGIITCMSTS